MTEEFELNGHLHKAIGKERVLVNPHELHVNREIGRQLSIGKVTMGQLNLTMLDKGVDMFNNLAMKAGLPLSMKTNSSFGIVGGQFRLVSGFMNDTLGGFLQPILDVLWWVLWVGAGLICVSVLIAVSPLFHVAMLLLRPVAGATMALTRLKTSHRSVSDRDYTKKHRV